MSIKQKISDALDQYVEVLDTLAPLRRTVTPGETRAYVEAAAQLAMLGLTPNQVREIAEAIAHSNVVAFNGGRMHIVGNTRGMIL